MEEIINRKKIKLSQEDIYEILEEKYDLYNRVAFIESDPVSIPHLFSKKEDIEIAGFLAATIAWGQRKTILKNAKQLVEWMDYAPHSFILDFTEAELKKFSKFVHRTFNGIDAAYFLNSLKNIYSKHHSIGSIIEKGINSGLYLNEAIADFRKIFFELPHEKRTEKHVSNPLTGASTKRLCMYLRWMVRKDNRGVDFGIWNIHPSLLMCPLDVHSGRVARKLGLLTRKQDDWQAVNELTENLRKFDPEDPVKYDFALFGLGVNEK
jgi:uncharacterized protein (TIGR02757 family)